MPSCRRMNTKNHHRGSTVMKIQPKETAMLLVAIIAFFLFEIVRGEEKVEKEVLLDESDTISRWVYGEVNTDSEFVKSGEASAKWKGAPTGMALHTTQVPTDWSRYRALSFWMHSS